MACYFPIHGYRATRVNPTGKRSIVFRRNEGYSDLPVSIPCGQCIGCRLQYSRQWAIRCVHEASLYQDNSFVTLTYAPGAIGPSLVKEHFVNFMKYLRRDFGAGIRFFHCGEYGTQNLRPHHHVILFNFDFPDKQFFRISCGHRLYTSSILSTLWPHGFSLIGDVSFESSAYVARYIVKKVTGKAQKGHYGPLEPPYLTMSRRPGIGRPWFDQFGDEVYVDDQVPILHHKYRPPKYYDSNFEKQHPDLFDDVKLKRSLIFFDTLDSAYLLRDKGITKQLRFDQENRRIL